MKKQIVDYKIEDIKFFFVNGKRKTSFNLYSITNSKTEYQGICLLNGFTNVVEYLSSISDDKILSQFNAKKDSITGGKEGKVTLEIEEYIRLTADKVKKRKHKK